MGFVPGYVRIREKVLDFDEIKRFLPSQAQIDFLCLALLNSSLSRLHANGCRPSDLRTPLYHDESTFQLNMPRSYYLSPVRPTFTHGRQETAKPFSDTRDKESWARAKEEIYKQAAATTEEMDPKFLG